MMTSPVIEVTPAATTCCARSSSAASGLPCTGAPSRPLLAYVWSLIGESSKNALPSACSRRPMLMSPDATSTRSPETTPASSGPVRYTGVWNRWSGPHASSSAAVAKDFMIEPGTNRVSPPSSNRTSPVSASRTAKPKSAWASRADEVAALIAARRPGGSGTPSPSDGLVAAEVTDTMLDGGCDAAAVAEGALTTAVVVDVAVDCEPVSEQADTTANSRATTPAACQRRNDAPSPPHNDSTDDSADCSTRRPSTVEC